MSNFSGLSAILSVTLVAVIAIQMLKDKFEVVENYGDMPHTFQNQPSASNVSEVSRNIPSHSQGLDSVTPHGDRPFGTGEIFRAPYIAQDSNLNGWNGFQEAFAMHQQTINAGTPNMDNLRAIGAETESLPGPNVFNNDSFPQANVNQGRADRLHLCSQNLPTNGATALNVASSLLPNPALTEKFEGFEECGTATNLLANQVFLSPGGQAGLNLTSGSNRNSNLDIRSAPPNPALYVGPWNLSTIYPDLTRRPLEGCGPSFGLYGDGPNSVATPSKINP